MAENNTRAWHAVLTKGSASLKKKLTLKHGDKPEFQRLLKSTGQDKETWYKMHQKKQARLRGEDPTTKEKERKQIGLKAWGATKGTRMGGEEGGGLTTDAPKAGKAVVGQHAGAGPVKTLSVAEYMKQKEEEQRREKAKAILAARKNVKEESEQTNEAAYMGKGNNRPGWMLRADPKLAKKVKDIKDRRKALTKWAGVIPDLKKEEAEHMDEATTVDPYPNYTAKKVAKAIEKDKKHKGMYKKQTPKSRERIVRNLISMSKNFYEESEQIDELKKSTLQSYRRSAKGELLYGNKYSYFSKKAAKRKEGIEKATKKIDDQVDEGLIKKINKRAKRLVMTIKGREKLGPVSKDLTWQQNIAQAVKAGRKMNEEAQHLIGVTVSEPTLKSAEPMLKKVRVKAASEQEAIKKAKAHYRKYGFKVHDAYHHSMITTVKKASQMDEGNKENKAKKNAYVANIIKKKLSSEVLPSIKFGRRELKKEEVEQIDELKRDTLISYVGKAREKNIKDSAKNRLAGIETPLSVIDKRSAKMSKRSKGIKQAYAILNKEEKESDVPFAGPYRASGVRKDQYGNVVKNRAKFLAKKALAAQEKKKKEKMEEAAKWRSSSAAKPDPDNDWDRSSKSTGGMRATSDTRGDTGGEYNHSSLQNRKKAQVVAKTGKTTKASNASLKNRIRANLAQKQNKPHLPEEVEQVDENNLGLRGLVSANPKSMPNYAYKTQKGKAAAAKKNIPALKSAIKSTLGKHPKPNLPEEVEQVDERNDMWHPDPKIDSKMGGRAAAIAQGKPTKKQMDLALLKRLAAAGKRIAAESLDKVGKETADIDNNGTVDKTDMYLHNKRAAIKKAITKKKLNEGKAAAAADKAIAMQRGKGNKINRKPTMEVDMKSQASPPPTHDGEDNSANVKV